MRKKNNNESKQDNTILTSYPIITDKHAKDTFVSRAEKTKEGANNYLNQFVLTMERVTANSGSFDFNSVIRESKVHEIPIENLRKLFADWVAHYSKLSKLSSVEGCYDREVYILH